MPGSRVVALIGLWLAAFAALVAPAPAIAHPVTPVALTPDTATADVAVARLPAAEATRSRESIALPAWVVAGVLLLVVAAGRSPRRAFVLALALLLTVFVFENALHSVHHGFDAEQYDQCAIAAASAQLSAVSVDHVVETSVVLAVAEGPTEPGQTRPSIRSLRPDQGRAPPVPPA